MSLPWGLYPAKQINNFPGDSRRYRSSPVHNIPEALKLLCWPKNKIKSVELLGHERPVGITQDEGGLRVKVPADKPCDYAYALKITGLKLKYSFTEVPTNTKATPGFAIEIKDDTDRNPGGRRYHRTIIKP